MTLLPHRWQRILFGVLLLLPLAWTVFHLGQQYSQHEQHWFLSGHVIQNQNWDGYGQTVWLYAPGARPQKTVTTVSGLYVFTVNQPGRYQIFYQDQSLHQISIQPQTPRKIYLGVSKWGQFRSYRPVISLIVLFSTLFYVLLSFLLFSRLKDKKLGFIFLLMSLPPFWINLIDATQDLLAYSHLENMAAGLFHLKHAFLILTAAAFPLLFLYFPKPQNDLLKKTGQGFLFFMPAIPLAVFHFISIFLTEDYFFKAGLGFSYAVLMRVTMLYLLAGVVCGCLFLLKQKREATALEIKKRLNKMIQVMSIFLLGFIVFVFWPVVFQNSQPYFAYQYPIFNAVSALILFLSWAYFIFQGKMAPLVFKIDARFLSHLLTGIYSFIYFALVFALNHYCTYQAYFKNNLFFGFFIIAIVLSFWPGRQAIQKIFELIFVTPEVKHTQVAARLSQSLLTLRTPADIQNFLKKELKAIYPGLKFEFLIGKASRSPSKLKNYHSFDLPLESIKGQWRLHFSHDYALPTETDWAFFNLIKGNLSIALLNAKLYQDLLLAYRQYQKIQSQLRHKETLAALGEMSATLAHEIKNPMTGISTFVQLFESQHEDADYIARFKKTMPAQVERIQHTLQKLLQFAKTPTVSLRKMDIAKMIRSEIDFLKLKHKGLSYAGPVSFWAVTDETLIQEVLQNLILNAFESNATQVKVSLSQTTTQWLLAIKDNGPGISKTLQKKIFQPFFSTKTYGTGLGLATVQKNIQWLDATLSLQSSAKGTLFKLEFPLSQKVSS